MSKVYELVIEDKEDEVFAISLVENPAIEADWIYFDKEVLQFAAIDNEQKMLIGPILIPDKKILRIDAEGQPYHVFFTKDTVKKLAQNYLMKNCPGFLLRKSLKQSHQRSRKYATRRLRQKLRPRKRPERPPRRRLKQG